MNVVRANSTIQHIENTPAPGEEETAQWYSNSVTTEPVHDGDLNWFLHRNRCLKADESLWINIQPKQWPLIILQGSPLGIARDQTLAYKLLRCNVKALCETDSDSQIGNVNMARSEAN